MLSRIMWPVLAFAAALCAFSPVLENGFVNFDDPINLLANAHYRGLGWENLRWMFGELHFGMYQPLPWLTFALDYLLWGMRAGGYHLTSLLFHALNAALFFLAARRLLEAAGEKDPGTLDLAVGFLPALGPPIERRALFRDPYVCLMRADHPIKSLTKKNFLTASHALVSYRGGHRVIEEALERAGVARRIALRVPHFTVVPMVLERTDLILTLPARVARVFERQGKLKSLPTPVTIPVADVGVHWHERFEADPGNRWLREQVIDLFAD